MRKRGVIALISTGISILTAGCGGGGGNSERPVPIAPPPPPPLPTPPPPPPPPLAPSIFDDEEYRRSTGPAAARALAAYDAGATGAGVKVGLIDTGINRDLPEFSGRIDPATGDMVLDRHRPVDTHGTAVASVLAGSRNDSFSLGVAFDATMISLDVSAADCFAGPCRIEHSVIPAAIDLAVDNGAKVINFSLSPQPTPELIAALERAAQAGVVLVFAAGNSGFPAPISWTQEIARTAPKGHIIIAGAHDQDRNIWTSSNRAGLNEEFLTALGVGVMILTSDERFIPANGTSFSTPIISGAAALLAGAFPHLSGKQIVEILLKSADDAGAPGFDPVFGNGILNIASAFAPLGSTSIAGSGTPVSLIANGRSSSAMGDAMEGLGRLVVLDSYLRAYEVNLGRTVAPALQEKPLMQAIGASEYRTAAAAVGGLAVSLTGRRQLRSEHELADALPGPGPDGRRERLVAGAVVGGLSSNMSVALGFSETGRTLQQRLRSDERIAYVVAQDPLSRSGFHASGIHSVGILGQLGGLRITATAERGTVYAPKIAGETRDEARYTLGTVSLDRAIGPAAFSLRISHLDEESSILGGRFSPALAIGGAATRFADASMSLKLGEGWGASAVYRRGWTRIGGRGGLTDGARILTDAGSLDIVKVGAFANGDKLALRVTQPLRVRSGGFDINLPISYDHATGRVDYELFTFDPSGREITLETAYGLDVLNGAGHVGVNAFLRRDPGHIAAMKQDLGAAFRFTMRL